MADESEICETRAVRSMKSAKFIFFLTVSLFFISSCKTEQIKSEINSETAKNSINSSQIPSENNEAKAIRLAEEFVKRNGYTEVRAEKDKIAYESEEPSEDINKILQNRYKTLEPKAFGLSYHSKSGDGWTVIFKYNEEYLKTVTEMDLSNRGRAVTMSKNFEEITMQHKDFFLEYAEKKLR